MPSPSLDYIEDPQGEYDDANNGIASKTVKMQKQKAPLEKKPSLNLLTKILVEGPEPSQDFSCKWVQKFD